MKQPPTKQNSKVLCVNVYYLDFLSYAFTSGSWEISQSNIPEVRGDFLSQSERQNTKWSMAIEDLNRVSSP